MKTNRFSCPPSRNALSSSLRCLTLVVAVLAAHGVAAAPAGSHHGLLHQGHAHMVAAASRAQSLGRPKPTEMLHLTMALPLRNFIAYFVGDRAAQSARALRERRPPAYRCRATRRDFWLAYEEVFPRRTHRPRDKSEGETNHVERWNHTLRHRPGRFVRKTLSFSKCERMPELALRRFIHEYNQQPII